MVVVTIFIVALVNHRSQLRYRAYAPPGMEGGHQTDAGVKMANELTTDEIASLKQILPATPEAGDEEIICFYQRESTPDDSEPEAVVLTTKRIAFRKGGRPTVFALAEIESVLDNDTYRAKYSPNHYDLTRYRIEIKRKSSALMRITIVPHNDGSILFAALQDAWMKARKTEKAPLSK
jgi:hypothetical protein